MRIGQFSESFFPVVDGVGRVAFNYAQKLAEMGHECYAVSPMTDTGYRGRFPFEIVDYVSVQVPGTSQYKMGFAIFDKHYNDRIDMIEFDIIHAHTPFTAGTEALRLSKKHKCPLIGTFHSKYYDDFYKATGAELIALLGVKYVVRFYEHCDEVWAVSKNSADTLRQYGYHGDIYITENGTDISAPAPGSERLAREKFGLQSDEPILLYVGQLDWKKNILNILEASEKLKRGGRNFKLVLAGQGADRSKIEESTSSLGIDSLTVFTGHITDSELLSGLYQCADLLVFPSVYDNSPLVLREAAAMATPSVVTAGSSSAEVIKPGINGYVAENTSDSLADVIASALDDKEGLEKAGRAARETIPVAWDIIMEKVLERYQNLIIKGRSDKNRKK